MKSGRIIRNIFSPLGLSITAIGTISLAGWFFIGRPEVELPDSQAGSPSIARNRTVDVGGVRRPASDVDPGIGRVGVKQSQADGNKPKGNPYFYGKQTPLDPKLNANVESVYVALTAKAEADKHPERLSPMIAPKQFDLESYQRDPASYLSIVEPGRVWQSAQPGPGVPVLKRISDRRQTLNQGESVRLQVQTAPDAPVTFTSFDLGAFQNQLTSITVASNKEGVAEAVFTGTPGTISKVNILAASPLASGNQKFEMMVLLNGRLP